MVNFSRVQFKNIEFDQTLITLIHNRLHTCKCFLVAPLEPKLKINKTLQINDLWRFSFVFSQALSVQNGAVPCANSCTFSGSIENVSRMLGHTSIRMTRHYAHAMNKVAAIMGE